MRKFSLFAVLLLFVGNIVAQNYHETDKEGLRKILRQTGTAYTERPAKPYITTIFEMCNLSIADTLNWQTSEEWVAKIKPTSSETALTWSGDSPKRLVRLSWTNGIDDAKFDLSYFPELKFVGIYINNNYITDWYCPIYVDASQNQELESVEFGRVHLQGSPVFAVGNKIESANIGCSSTFLGSSLSSLSNLKELIMSYSGSGVFDFSNNPLIERIEATNNNITKIDASTNDKLQFLDCSYGKLTELYVSNSSVLTELKCDYNFLNFTTMPNREFATKYTAGPQSPIGLTGAIGQQLNGNVSVSEGIDLSAFYSFRGINTTYNYILYEEDREVKLENNNGVIKLTSDLIGRRVTCDMTNACFPGVTLQYAYDVVGVPIQTFSEEDKAGLRKILRQTGTAYTQSTSYTTTNFELNGLAVSDTLTWMSNEDWVIRVSYANTLLWNDDFPRRLTGMTWRSGVDNTKFQLSDFSELQTAYLSLKKYGPYNNAAIVDISNCPKLTEISGGKVTFTDNSFLADNNVESVSFSDSKGSYDFTKSPKLRSASVATAFGGNGIANCDFSKCPQIKSIFINTYAIENINLAGAFMLEEFTYNTNGFESDVIKNIDFSDCVNLQQLNLGGYLSGLKSLDLSNNIKLEKVGIYSLLGLEQDIVWGNVNLQELDATECASPSGSLDLSKMTNLKILKYTNSKLKSLKLPTQKLVSIDLADNALFFSQLPLSTSADVVNVVHQFTTTDILYVPCTLDLSKELIVDGKSTVFEWEVTTLSYMSESFYPTHNNGVFELSADLADKYVDCKMTHPSFPGITVAYGAKVLARSVTDINEEALLDSNLVLQSNTVRQGEPIVVLSEKTGVAFLYSVSGQQIQTVKVASGKTDLSAPSAGLYLLKVSLENGIYKTFKILVK